MPEALRIARDGEMILQQRAAKVENVRAPAIQGLIDNMIDTCLINGGVGIAAPQVFHSLRIFIIASSPGPVYPNAPKMRPLAIINPRVIWWSKMKVPGPEGCMSMPGVRGVVYRHLSLTAEYTARDGQVRRETFDGFPARIFQHENDHLNGIMFTHRAIPSSITGI